VTGKWKCSRCGKQIEDDEDSMILYEADPRDWERMLAAGENPLDDAPPVLGRYCELCTAIIEERHEAHDEMVERFRDELEKGMP
jgi:hypothetical protein